MERSDHDSSELADWADRLERAVEGTRFDDRRVRVLASCDSTQDLARELGTGAVVTTGHQRRGRGRLGRSWADDEGVGIAISLGLPAIAPEFACLAAAVAARSAVRDAMIARGLDAEVGRLGLKFPNDLVDAATARKLGGILVEVVDDLAIVGIGINVGGRSWPADVPGISIEEMGSSGRTPDRIEIMERLPAEIDRCWNANLEDVRREFMAAHAPTGCLVRIEESVSGGAPRSIEGRLVDLDPCRLLRVDTPAGTREIPTPGARIVSWRPDSAKADPTST